MHFLVDTNLIVRLITWDRPTKAREAREIFDKAAAGQYYLVITKLVIAEVLYVLTSPNLYKLPRDKAVLALEIVLGSKSVHTEDKTTIMQTLHLFKQSKLDFVDCYLVVCSQNQDKYAGLFSFDKDLNQEVTKFLKS